MDLQISSPPPPLDFPADDGDDPKYLAGLSTILVATVQEIKDRVSQVEFLFCSQIFPGFQSTAKSLHHQLAGSREAAGTEWRSRESDLVRRIEVLSAEKLELAAKVDELREKIGVLEAEAVEREKGEVLREVEGLRGNEEAVEEMRERIRVVMAEKKDMKERLLEEMAVKDKELMGERTKRRRLAEGSKELNERYKRVKSQYKFLLKKSGLVVEKDGATGDVGGFPVVSYNQKSALEFENEDEDITPLGSEPNDPKSESSSLEKLEDKKDPRPAQNTKMCYREIPSYGSASVYVNRIPGNVKVKHMPAIDMKRSKSTWRDTRANQEQRGLDPHDDFLDTPLENIRRNFNKATHDDMQDVPIHAPNNMDFNIGDDETQEVNDQSSLQKQPLQISNPPNRGFKYVEPVRKKAERENLKGVECNQCKKFYDAVLPDGSNKNGNNSNNIRCEHHDGISRHRYRCAPPMTPEGFWNIGFDSEM